MGQQIFQTPIDCIDAHDRLNRMNPVRENRHESKRGGETEKHCRLNENIRKFIDIAVFYEISMTWILQ